MTDRIWQAFWRAKGGPIETIAALVAANLASDAPEPFCLVAHDGGTFCGTCSLIAHDVATRPDLTPWVAALWVDERFRRSGLGARLLHEVAARAFKSGHDRLYLLARDELTEFYVERGWRLIEREAGDAGKNIFEMNRDG